MPQINLGPISPKLMGTHDIGVPYKRLNMVKDGTNSWYMAKTDLPVDISLQNTVYWTKLIEGDATNTTDIATNKTDIATNTTDIATNTTDIATNTTDIATNTTDIATNTTNIATNTTDIATNTTDIATNTTDIATNTTNIATNTTNIATNTTNIATNTTDIEGLNQNKIEANNYATATVGGTVKVRVAGDTLFITTDGTDA